MSCRAWGSSPLSGTSHTTNFSIRGMAGVSTTTVARRNRVFISATVTVVMTVDRNGKWMMALAA